MLFEEKRFNIRSAGKSGPATGRSLLVRRVWFADDDDKGSGDSGDEGTGDGLSGSDGSGGSGGRDAGQGNYDHIKDKDAYIESLEKRIKDSKNKGSSSDDELKQLRSFRDKALREDGNHATLLKDAEAKLAELEPKSARLEALVEGIRSRNDERIKALPEDKRDAASMLVESLSPEQLSSWLDTAAPLFAQAKPPGTDAGRGAGMGGGATVTLTSEQKQTAKRHGMTEEQYIAAMAKASPDS